MKKNKDIENYKKLVRNLRLKKDEKIEIQRIDRIIIGGEEREKDKP